MNTAKIIESLAASNEESVNALRNIRSDMSERRESTVRIFDNLFAQIRVFQDSILEDYDVAVRSIDNRIAALAGGSNVTDITPTPKRIGRS